MFYPRSLKPITVFINPFQVSIREFLCILKQRFIVIASLLRNCYLSITSSLELNYTDKHCANQQNTVPIINISPNSLGISHNKFLSVQCYN